MLCSKSTVYVFGQRDMGATHPDELAQPTTVHIDLHVQEETSFNLTSQEV